MMESFKCRQCEFEADVPQAVFNYCPGCGALGSIWQDVCHALLTLYDNEGRLKDASQLFGKAAYTEAARAALLTLEVELKNRGQTDSFGAQLVDEVLGFEYDKKSEQFRKEPKVRINELTSQIHRNEQDGFRMLMAGMFKGLRNTLIHNQVRLSAIHALAVIVISDFLVDMLDKGSITNPRVCVWTRVTPPEKEGEKADPASTTDTAIEEIHQVRREISEKFGGDIAAIAADAERRARESGRPRWKPTTSGAIAKAESNTENL